MNAAAMNIAEQLPRPWPPNRRSATASGRCSFGDAGERLTCQLVALDSLACALVELELHSDRLLGAGAKRLEVIASSLSKRLSYLLEPIHPIETDADRCVVQMRSSPPRKHAAGTDYYELLVTAQADDHIWPATAAHRGHAGPDRAQLTHEVLVRLAGDFVAAVGA